MIDARRDRFNTAVVPGIQQHVSGILVVVLVAVTPLGATALNVV